MVQPMGLPSVIGSIRQCTPMPPPTRPAVVSSGFSGPYVAFLDVEAVKAQQGGLPAVDIGRHLDGYTLVRMILDIGIPQLVLNDEGQGIGDKSGTLRLRHVGRSCWGFARAYRGRGAVTRATTIGSPPM